MSCAVCSSPRSAVIANVDDGILKRCISCSHVFFEPGVEPHAQHLYGDHYAGYRDDPVFRRHAGRILREHILGRLPHSALVVDVGCGNGEFLDLARDAGCRVLGFDVSTAAVTRCQQRGMDARAGDFRDPLLWPPGLSAHLITFWDVIEHLPDPASFVRRAAEVLLPGGYVFIKTPLTRYLSVRVTATLPRLSRALLQTPSHVHFFTPEAVSDLLRRAGFGEQYWLPQQGIRGRATGGGMRKRVARAALRAIHRASGDGNVLVLARRE